MALAIHLSIMLRSAHVHWHKSGEFLVFPFATVCVTFFFLTQYM